MSDQRERNQIFKDALLCSPRFNSGTIEVDRQAAIDWGYESYQNEIEKPFTPSGHGALDAGFWPAYDGKLVELQEKGRLPDNADLEYGITVKRTYFRGIRRLDDGAFIAVVSGDASYANKVEAATSEPVAEAEDNAETAING